MDRTSGPTHLTLTLTLTLTLQVCLLVHFESLSSSLSS
jgi:hypothetical protein